MANQVKRKKVVVSIETKLEALKKLDSGYTIKAVAAMYGVGEVTVGDWRRNRKTFEQWFSNQASSTTGRKTMKSSDYESVGHALFLWFTQQRQKGVPVSGPILQEKALSFAKKVANTESFSASTGWLDRWKKRHGIRQLSICGEKLSADVTCIEKFKADFEKEIREKGYTLDQVYNCDETGLNYKMLPSKTLASKEEKAAPGHKMSKERVTIMACANATGEHKLPLFLIGKSAKPRALKDISANALPVCYRNQKSAWMDGALFKEWFYEQFVPKVERFLKAKKLPIKALLLMDNAPSHPSENELRKGEIIVKFLPPNVTSLLQPMDQGVLENLKRHYRRFLLQCVLDENSEDDLRSAMRKINMKHVVYWASQAWNNVRTSTIAKS